MGINGLPFEEKDIKRVLQSAEGQQILKLLNRDGGQKLRAAAEAFSKGNLDEAKKILAPIMETDEASKLVDKLNNP